jgi:sugar lactone lactonase YvrE
MSVMPAKFPAKYAASKLFSLPLLGLAFCASSAWAQVPAVVVDAQQVVGTGYNNPQSIAVSKNGTVYIADTSNNRIVALATSPPLAGTNTVVSTGLLTPALTGPQALAFDANGDLFVGDTPTIGGKSRGRITEFMGNGNGGLSGVVKSVFAGAPLANPISLTVDSTGTLFIGDYPTSGVGKIYSLASGALTPTLLNITGLSHELTPAALLRVSTNLYIADNGNGKGSYGGLAVAPAAGGAAQPVATPSFTLNGPSGLALDAAGNIYVLSLLGTGTGYNPGQQVLVIPAASPDTPYILPNTALGTSTSMAFDQLGNLDVLALGAGNAGEVVQLAYVNPVNLGSIAVNSDGTHVPFNFEFNAPFTLDGFSFLTQGDTSTEVVQALNGTCSNGKHTDLPDGGPKISPSRPYTCQEAFYGDPTFPGLRSSSIQVKGSAGAILDSTSVYLTGLAGVEVTYPLNTTATAVNLEQPQAVVISGLNRKVYVADTQAAKVYYTEGVAGTTLIQVSTGTITLSAPCALALDAAGNLYIGDFNLGEVIKVPITTGGTPSVLNAGGLLQHPLALTFDQLGNLYIGDAGSAGLFAGTADPGYVVKIPAGGTPYKMTIPSVTVVFPQALVADPNTNALVIGDGGDPSGVGQVVQVSANGSTASVVAVAGVTNPTGLAFDTAEDLYVLDGTANTLTAVPPARTMLPQHIVEFNNLLLSSASALGISAGGQSFIIGNIGEGNKNSLVYLNGNRSTLLFGDVKVGTSSQFQTATEYNIGNSVLTLDSPFYTTNESNSAFSVLGSSTCGNGAALNPSASCTINVQFSPVALGSTSQDITVQSDAYNPGSSSGAPILRVAGTGSSK